MVKNGDNKITRVYYAVRNEDGTYGELHCLGETVDDIEMIQCAEIVRCNSCTHWQNGHICKKFSKFGTIETKSDFYCGYSEKEGGSLGKAEGDSTTQRQLRGT